MQAEAPSARVVDLSNIFARGAEKAASISNAEILFIF